jgi:uncharacterized protein YvpB
MVNLNIPYKSQLDNRLNPTGSCNVTSVAMCLAWLGITPRNPKVQLEDELYAYAEKSGYSRRSPEDLAQIVRDYGHKDTYTSAGTILLAQQHLKQQKSPCIIHGYFTESGHIIVLTGYDAKGFFVHDPYGEFFEGGYRTDLSGKNLHYSYELIKRKAMPDGHLWLHRISK